MPWYDYVNLSLLSIIWLLIFSSLVIVYKARKYWIFFLTIYTLTELIGLPLSLKGISNLWLYNISKPIQFILLLVYFIKVLRIGRTYSQLLLVLTVLICSFFVVRMDIREYDSWGDAVYSSFVIILCIVYFYDLITSNDSINLELSEFWYCAGLFVFFGTNLCVNSCLNFLLEEHVEIARKLFYILVISSVIFYLLIIYALISEKRKTTTR